MKRPPDFPAASVTLSETITFLGLRSPQELPPEHLIQEQGQKPQVRHWQQEPRLPEQRLRKVPGLKRTGPEQQLAEMNRRN
jgi:hypothetical protein